MSDHSQGIVNSKNSMEPVPFRVAVLALALIASSQLARSQKLAQPMRLVILGTGTPVADPARFPRAADGPVLPRRPVWAVKWLANVKFTGFDEIYL